MSKRKRAEIEPSAEHIDSARRESAAHDAAGLFYEDPHFAALARIARASEPCAPDDLAHVGASATEARLPTDAEARAAALALADLREEHLRRLAARAAARTAPSTEADQGA